MLPLVSVIIPTYNYANFICRSIQSVLNQSYPKELIEIIVVDDGSADNTQEVLTEWIRLGIIKYYFQKNKGKAAATAKAIEESNGEVIFNLDADDYFLEEKIGITVSLFTKYPNLVHVASPANIVFEDSNKNEIEKIPTEVIGKTINGLELLYFFYEKRLFFGSGSTFSAKASILKKNTIPVEVDMYIDEFLLLTTLPYGETYFYPEPLSTWVVHKKNCSGNQIEGRVQKNERLLNSSAAILNYLEQNSFDKFIRKIYRLQHANREIYFEEVANKKSLKHILKFSTILIKSNLSFKILKQYSVFNRLVPAGLIKILRK